MAFSPKNWLNSPSTTTPLSAAALQDIEARTTATGFGGVVLKTGNYTAVAGDVVYSNPASGGATITLPSAVASTTVTIIAGAAASGTNQTTVASGSSNILGPGLSTAGVSSFPLGAAMAQVVLASDGTSWYTVSGCQDTGSVALTLAVNWTDFGSDPAKYRLIGDRVLLRAVPTNNTGGNSTTPFATFPALIRPGTQVNLTVSVASGGTFSVATATVATNGVVTTTPTTPNAANVAFDGCIYALS